MSSPHQTLTEAFLDSGHYSQALKHVQQWLAEDPEDALAYYSYGRILYGLEKYSDAVQYFLRHLQLEPDSVWGHYFLGASYWHLGSFQSAQKHIDECLRLDPEYGSALLIRAGLLNWEKKYHESRTLLLRILSQYPDSAYYLTNIAYYASQNPQFFSKEIRELYLKAIQIDPEES